MIVGLLWTALVLLIIVWFWAILRAEKPSFKAGDVVTFKPDPLRESWEPESDVKFYIVEVGKNKYRYHLGNADSKYDMSIYMLDRIGVKDKA